MLEKVRENDTKISKWNQHGAKIVLTSFKKRSHKSMQGSMRKWVSTNQPKSALPPRPRVDFVGPGVTKVLQFWAGGWNE